MKKSVMFATMIAVMFLAGAAHANEGYCVEDIWGQWADGNWDTWTSIGSGQATYNQQCAAGDPTAICTFNTFILVELWETVPGDDVPIDSGAIDVARYNGNECS